MNCSSRSGTLPLEDQGLLRIRPAVQTLAEALSSYMSQIEVLEDHTLQLGYSGREDVLEILKLLVAASTDVLGGVLVQLSGLEDMEMDDSWIPPHILKSRIEHSDMVHLMMQRCFTSYMQPIVDLDTKVIGYEFLLRPLSGVRVFQPFQLFEVARKTGLLSFLDNEARISAIEASARWLPNGIKRFINFLPSSINDPQYCLDLTFEAIDRLSLNPQDFVFEVVETEQIDDMRAIQQIFEQYRSRGMSVALDDLGAGYSTLEVMNRLQPDYVKIDRGIIDGCHQDADKQRQISQIVESARRFAGRVLAEGIEQREDFEFCREAGVSLAQGYLFGKPDERPVCWHRALR
ncbi:EAL domain-containing protein [Paenibacillus sp. P96]|uniref:EAL domain-containing protein n=1 Tax=Paenibacillus zeirhizosphaerae TaxID=2987519 RepID=A0ABT9FMS8_9BACL|nr:EAL domain-containing protein [Paenibacillus sp. P96]MDP4096021.1 EAL domain-containing protein [Paenibacillus sp. P96]